MALRRRLPFHSFLVSKKIISLEISREPCTFMSWLSDTLVLSGNTIRSLLMWIWEGALKGIGKRERYDFFLAVHIFKIDSLNLFRMEPLFRYHEILNFEVYFLVFAGTVLVSQKSQMWTAWQESILFSVGYLEKAGLL